MFKRQYANSNSQLAGRKTWVRPFVLRTTLVLLLTSVVSLPSSAADAQISRKVLFGGITYSGPYDFSELNSFEAAARETVDSNFVLSGFFLCPHLQPGSG